MQGGSENQIIVWCSTILCLTIENGLNIWYDVDPWYWLISQAKYQQR